MSNEIIRAEQPKSWLQPTSIDQALTLADTLSKSQLVPKHFQGKKEDCLMAILISQEKGIGLWDVFQNGFIIHGKFGWDTKFAVQEINKSARIKGGLKFTREAKQEITMPDKTKVVNLEYTAWAIDAETGDKLTGPTVSVKTAIDAGWWDKNPLWRTDTENMLWQRAAKRWGNMHGIGVGGSDKDEITDGGDSFPPAQVIDTQPLRKATAPVKTPKAEIEEVQMETVNNNAETVTAGDDAQFQAMKAEHTQLSGGDAEWMSAINAATTIAELEAAKEKFDL